MAYTLLDAAYAMYHPEAEFAEGKGGLMRRAKATALRGARMAKRGGKAALRGAGAAKRFAMKNKLGTAAGGLALAGLALSRRGKKGGSVPPYASMQPALPPGKQRWAYK